MRPFSVLLLYPDFLAENYGEDTHYAQVEAEDANDAVYKARLEVAEKEADDMFSVEELIADFLLLLVIEGHHADLSAEAQQ